MDLKKISKQIRALDTPEKLKIVALLADEGRKSISDVARELKIHFSTTHKYLEQLERAGLVHSKTVKEDRLKRYFYVKDFDLRLSPGTLTAAPHSEEESKSFDIINNYGVKEALYLDNLIAAYVASGIPYAIAHSSIKHLEKEMYAGITYAEIQNILSEFFVSQLSLLQDSLKGLEMHRIKEKTIQRALYLLHPELLKKHTEGEIFIRNLGRPRLLNFIHDSRGLSVHGIAGAAPKTFAEFAKQLCTAVDKINDFCIDKIHGIYSVNYALAPFHELKQISSEEMSSFLEGLSKRTNKMYISIDIGKPRIMDNLPLSFFMKDDTRTYSIFSKVAEELASLITKLVSSNKFPNIKLVLNVWDKDKFNEFASKHQLKSVYIANLLQDWQTENACYIGPICRSDCRWRHWLRLSRVGEIQNTTINLPRLAAASKTYPEFLKKVEELITQIVDSYSDLTELAVGEYLRSPIELYSSQRRKWHYCEINDCIYSISICGVAEAFKELKVGGTLENYEKLLKAAHKSLTNPHIRIQLKEEHHPLVLQRLCSLDNKKQITNYENYSGGLGCKNIPLASLHKYLLGGHCSRSKDYKEILQSGSGLTFID